MWSDENWPGGQRPPDQRGHGPGAGVDVQRQTHTDTAGHCLSQFTHTDTGQRLHTATHKSCSRFSIAFKSITKNRSDSQCGSTHFVHVCTVHP